ncbi:MAG: glycine dehydrogenase (aminomethyl-transferring), partial [Actinomycetota bacterium]
MARKNFADRHIGPSDDQVGTMLHELGYSDLARFIADVLPETIKLDEVFGGSLPNPISEPETISQLRSLADKNQVFQSLIGMGYYGTHTPPVILRNVLENPAWYTAYTPYQPEISQGRLEALFAFQTMVSDLTGLAIANASMLDEATAAAEAMTLARRASKSSDDAIFLIDAAAHPQTKAVVQTRAKPLGIAVREFEVKNVASAIKDAECFAILVQYPNTLGALPELMDLFSLAKEKNVLVIMATDLLALTLIKSPGEWGADIAVGSAQRFGVPMGFGGP